jgi:2-polyprenyl-3-methyl-5-hydroxy-6-metoxy-1,4-benzoquinol methylase
VVPKARENARRAAQLGGNLDRHSGLEATFDGATFRYLAATGVGAGWCCWEIGAGGGSIARWLAEQVAPGGSVLATDLEIKWMRAASAAMRVARHEVTSDPIPENAYDLIHARLVLVHLLERDRVLAALAAALRPGGWLVVEDFDSVVRASFGGPSRSPWTAARRAPGSPAG